MAVVQAGQYVANAHLPFFFTVDPDEPNPATCSSMQPVQLDSGYNVVDPSYKDVGVLEPIRDRGACLDAMKAVSSTYTNNVVDTLSQLPDGAQCSGCFFTKRGASPR